MPLTATGSVHDRDETPPEVNDGAGTSWVLDAIALVIYGALGFLAYVHLWFADGPAGVRGAVSDPAQSMWFLAYTPFAVSHGHLPLLTGYANAPYGVNLVDNTSMAALGVALWPVTALFGPARSYDAAMTMALATSAAAAYWLLRRWVRWRPAAFVGGLVYGFSPYMVGQGAVHLNLVFVPFVPLICLLLDELIVRRRRSPEVLGLLIALAVAVQFFISTEVLTTTTIVVIIGLGVLVCSDPLAARKVALRVARGLGTAVVVAAGLLAYPVWLYLRGPDHLNGPIQTVPQLYRADLLGFIVPSILQRIAPAQALHVSSGFIDSGIGENGVYLGVPLLVLALVAGVVLWRRAVVRLAVIMLVVSAVLSMGARLEVGGTPVAHPHGGIPLPEALFSYLGPLKNITPVRMGLYSALCAAVLLAVSVDALRSRLATGRAPVPVQWLVLGGVVGLVLAPLAPRIPYPATTLNVPRFFTTDADSDIPTGATAILYPFPGYAIDNSAPLLWQADTAMHFRIAGGYFLVRDTDGATTEDRFSYTRYAFDLFASGMKVTESPQLRQLILGEWRAWHVTVVVADTTARGAGEALTFIGGLVGTPARIDHGVALWSLATKQ